MNANDNPTQTPAGVTQSVKLLFFFSLQDGLHVPVRDPLINKLGCKQ